MDLTGGRLPPAVSQRLPAAAPGSGSGLCPAGTSGRLCQRPATQLPVPLANRLHKATLNSLRAFAIQDFFFPLEWTEKAKSTNLWFGTEEHK